MEENSEGQPDSDAGADEWQDDAVPSRWTTPWTRCSTQCLHADAHHERSQLCSHHLTKQLRLDDPKVSRNASIARTAPRKQRVRSPPPDSQPCTANNHCLWTVTLCTLDCSEPVRLPKSHCNEFFQPSPTDEHRVFSHLCQCNQFTCDKSLVNIDSPTSWTMIRSPLLISINLP